MHFFIKDCSKEDAGKGIARISRKIFDEMGLKPGDIVVIKTYDGNNQTFAKIHSFEEQGEEDNFIKIDGCTRDNLKAGLGRKITIEKVKVQSAERVKIGYFKEESKKEILALLKEKLSGRVININDYVDLYCWGNKYRFVILESTPINMPLKITDDTKIEIQKLELEESQNEPPEIIEDGINIEKMKTIFDEIIKGDEMINESPEKAIQHYQMAYHEYDPHRKGINLLNRLALANVKLGLKKKEDKYFKKAKNFYQEALRNIKHERGKIRQNLRDLYDLRGDSNLSEL